MRDQSVVLLVQADPNARSILASALGQAGLRVTEAGCGAEAIALASEVSPSLAVVDSQLSDIQSCELISHLKDICPVVTELSSHGRRDREEKLEILLELGESLYSARTFDAACEIALDRITSAVSGTGGIAAVREDGMDVTINSIGEASDNPDLVQSACQLAEDMEEDRPFIVSGALIFPAKLHRGNLAILAVLGIKRVDEVVEDPLVIRLGRIISKVFFKLFHHDSLHDKLDIKAAELECFHDAGQAVLQARNSWDSAVGMLDNIALLAGASGCVLFAKIEDTMQVVAHTGEAAQIPQGSTFSRSDTIAWSVLEMGEPLLICDIKSNGLRLDRLVASKAKIESALYMPLFYKGSSLGVLAVGFDGGTYANLPNVAEPSSNALAAQAALLVDGIRLLQKLDVEHRKLAATFDAIPGVICVCDQAVKMIMTNNIGNQMVMEEIGHWVDGFNTEGKIQLTRPDGSVYTCDDIPVARSITTGDYIWGEQVIVEFPSGRTIAALVNSAPIHSSDGVIIGGVMILQDISELRNAHIELQQSLDREHRVAERLQTAFLPEDLPELQGFDLAGKYIWAREDAGVGGDFYDIFQLPDGNTGIVMADVSGKGVQAAVYTAMTKYALRAYALEGLPPDKVIDKLNQFLCESMPTEYFVTLFFGVIDSSTRKLSYVNAGHEHPFLLNTSVHSTLPLDVTGRALGLFPQSLFAVHEMPVRKGDVIVLYTDGLTEYPVPGGMLGVEGLTAILEGVTGSTAKEIVDEIWNAPCLRSTGRVRDDVAILCLRAI